MYPKEINIALHVHPKGFNIAHLAWFNIAHLACDIKNNCPRKLCKKGYKWPGYVYYIPPKYYVSVRGYTREDMIHISLPLAICMTNQSHCFTSHKLSHHHAYNCVCISTTDCTYRPYTCIHYTEQHRQ